MRVDLYRFIRMYAFIVRNVVGYFSVFSVCHRLLSIAAHSHCFISSDVQM